MRITEGRLRGAGIDLCSSYNDKKYVISAGRDENGKIFFVESEAAMNKLKAKHLKNIIVLIAEVVLIPLAYALTYKSMKSSIVGIFGVAFFLMAIYLCVYWQSKKKKNQIIWRYRAANRMATNYFEEFERAPKNIEELSKMEKTSIFDSSAIHTFMVLSLFLQLINFLLIKYPLINCILMWASLWPLYNMWNKGYFNILQNLIIKEPTENELEVAMAALIRMEQTIRSKDPEYDN